MRPSDKKKGTRPEARSPREQGFGPGRSALIIFAKAPIPGQVKTRLCPPLTDDEAATLHGSLVLDVLERTKIAGVDRFLACAPSPEHVFFKIMEERHGVRLLPQTGADLGVRMREAFRAVFDVGYRRAALVGTDVPAVSGPLISQALTLLRDHGLVLGPAIDGGYYLVALERLVPELFAGIPWSSAQVCALTQRKAEALQLTVGLLPRHRDLDTVDDVLAMVSKQEAPGLSKRTVRVLQSLKERIRTRGAQAS